MGADTTTPAASGNMISDSVGSLAGWWTNTFGEGAGATAKGKELDAKLAAMNQEDYAPGGRIYQATVEANGGDTSAADAAYTADQINLANQAYDTATYESQITQAAQQGAADGLAKAKAGTNQFFADLFKLVPASIWIIAAGALFLYFGGWSWLERNARKHLK